MQILTILLLTSVNLVGSVSASTKDPLIPKGLYYLDSGTSGSRVKQVLHAQTIAKSATEGLCELTYSPKKKLLCATGSESTVVLTNLANGHSKKLTLHQLFPRSWWTDERKDTVESGNYSCTIDPSGSWLYVELDSPVEIWRASLIGLKPEPVISQTTLEHLTGKKLDWGEGPASLSSTIRISPSGLLAFVLPGKSSGAIGQKNTDTYMFSPQSGSLKRCGRGAPVLWEDDTKLLLSNIVFPARVNRNDIPGIYWLELINFTTGSRTSIRGYSTAAFTGDSLILLPRKRANETGPVSKLQNFTADLKNRIGVAVSISPKIRPINDISLIYAKS